LTRPVIERGIQMLGRQYGLREDVAERRAQPAAGWVDVALPALETQLNCQIGLGMRRICTEAQQNGKAAQVESNISANH
jgi:hypothetical protein